FEEGYPGVHDGMFAECKQLKKVTLSSTVTAIGNCAFKNCESLEDINIPEAVERICSEAFKNCSFKSVTIRNGISYYSSVYSDCKNLKEVVLEEGKVQTGDSWFSGCIALEKVEMPSSVTTIGSNSFSDCVSLKEIDLSNIKTIGSGAFARCRSLTEVNLPKIGEIKANAFVGCIKLRKVNVAGINSWARVTFENALSNPIYYARCIYENGEPVIFPRFITPEINKYAFVNCSSFLSASFEGNSAHVDNYAFSCCDRLRTVIMLKNPAYLSRNTFAGCNSLRNIIDFSGEFDTDYEVLDLTKKVTVYASKYYPSYDEMRMGYELMYKHNCETSGHKYVNGYFDLISAPTCTEKGQADYKCIYCGKVKWNSIGKLNHIINEVVVESATVEVDGKIIEKCALCGIEKETAIPKIAEIKFKNGDTFYRDTMFNDINNSLVITDSTGKEIPHKYFSVSFPEANVSYGIVKITFSGYYSGTAEKRFLILPGKVKLTVRELGQNSILLGWKSPPFSSQCPVEIFISEDNETFISLGKTTEDNFLIESLSAGKEYYFKAVVSNENGGGEPAYLTIKTINHFHSPVLKKTEEKTCLNSGMNYYECSSCGETWSEVIKATGHNWKCTNVIVEPTCISTGFKEYKCKDCDKKLSIVVPFSDHKVVKDPLVPATLTADGKTEGSHCSVCNEIIEEPCNIVKIDAIWIKDTYEYDGSVHKPGVFIRDADGDVMDKRAYSVKYSSKSPKEIGTYTATVTLKNNYSGTKVLTFKIVPQQVADLKCDKTTTNSVTLSWSKVTGAKYYKVEKSIDGKKWTKAVTVKTNTATVKSLKAGTNYRFRVTALDSTKKLEGKASTPIKAGTVTDAPSITLTSTKSKTATVSWNKVKGASNYVVYKSTDGKNWTKITVCDTSYTMKKLTGGKKIYVKVQAVNAYNQKSALSEVKKVTVKK
ncbi:MAG: leucine-rich repeat protein, partial [Acutalibacteraceae bacterium]